MDDWDRFGGSSSDGRNGFTMRDPNPGPEQNTQQNTYQYSQQQSQQTGPYTQNYYGGYAEPPKKKKEPQYVTRKFLVVSLIFAMIFSAAIGAGAYALAMSTFGGTTIDKTINTTNYNLAQNTGSTLAVQEIVAKNENSVVAIVTESVTTDIWLRQYVTEGAGSGVIISEDGYIVTNNHVIKGASNIRVTLHDGTEANASLISADEQTDLAVIKIEKTGLIPATFGDSDKLCVGDMAIAIGNPLGTLAGSATEGIISGLEREITLDGKTMILIQTSASINPGNSGGGLFDQYGNLIGIVVAKSAGSEVEGLGFAIPGNLAQKVTASLIENGYVDGRPAAGINIIDLTDASKAMQYGVQITGVYITEVTGDNAKLAGLEAGDMIYYLDDVKITSSSQLVNLIQRHEIGDEVTFTIVRKNELHEISVVLEDSQKIKEKAAEKKDQ